MISKHATIESLASIESAVVDAPSALTGRLIPRDTVDAARREAMFALMLQHFRGVEREVFEADLAEKHWIILLEDADGVLRGFSTLFVSTCEVGGIPRVLVYSGDTIVDRAAWGTRTLPRLWIDSVMRICERYPTDEVYWLLLTSGFRTYRFLPVFYRWFHPRYDEPTASDVQALIEAFARERFGPRYDPTRGIVRFARPQVLHPDLLAVPEGRRVDPHVAFFLERNPGYVEGDELVCLTRIARANLTPAGRRMLDGPVVRGEP
jgi:hypothetical protein